jgi:hypothetical protein
VHERLWFWWRVLRLGTGQVNALAGWLGTIILVIGIIAGVTVSLVFHLSPWLIAVILLSLLVLVTAEGGYQVWRECDQERRTAEGERDNALRDVDRDVRDRSEDATRRLLSSVAELDSAVAKWEKGQQDSVSSELTAAYNAFNQAQVADAGELADPELRRRVELHSVLTGACLAAIRNDPGIRPQVSRLLREHARSVSDALKAHQRGADLPAYDTPPLKTPVDLKALFAWRAAPSP